MSQQLPIRGRRAGRRKKRSPKPFSAVFRQPAVGGAAALAYPGYIEIRDEDSRRTVATGLLAALLHATGFGLLLWLAALAPAIQERIIPVQILHPEPASGEEAAPAPKALAERRPLPFDPAVQAVDPQIVNPRVLAAASPAVRAEALEMDSLETVTAPAEIQRTSRVVDRVSVVASAARAHVAPVDVGRVAGPVVRGPTRVAAPVGPSAGPRRVEAATTEVTLGTALQIGGSGASVKEGVLSDRDVVGSPAGAVVMAVDTTIGDGLLYGGTGSGSGAGTGAGTGTGTGTGTGSGSSSSADTACLQRPEVQSYIDLVRDRTIQRWVLPPGVDAGRHVTLRFRLDVAGSASDVSILRAEDNALGASAVDALRAAAPFPPMPDRARCLARVPIRGTFSNPLGG